MDREKKNLRIALDFAVAAIVILADQLTKLICVYKLKGRPTFPIIENVIHFTYVENSGAAFGMLKDARWIFMALTTVFVAVLIYLLIRYNPKLSYFLNVSLAFIIGGGIGNMIDRSYAGYVVDFIDFRLIDFAVFNVADSFVTVGVAMLMIDLLFGKGKDLFSDKKPEKEEKKDEDPSGTV